MARGNDTATITLLPTPAVSVTETVAKAKAKAKTKARPIPRDVKAAAAALAALGDPHRLAILGAMADGVLYTLDGLTGWFGLDADKVSAALGVLKNRGLVLAIREAGKRGWRYRITEAGKKAWTRAQEFGG